MIDITKQYRTREGYEVRLYADNCGGDFPIHGAYREHNLWRMNTWTIKGLYWNHDEESEYDLVEVKSRIKRTYWLNVYPEARGATILTSRENADKYCIARRIACVEVEIDCEEGEGL